MLEHINQIRSTGRQCGDKFHPRASKLYYDCALQRAANKHANDLASNLLTGHVGSDGSTPDERMKAAGFPCSACAENAAYGPADAEKVVEAWLASPGHCSNIMRDDVTSFAASYAYTDEGDYHHYWVQVFGGL